MMEASESNNPTTEPDGKERLDNVDYSYPNISYPNISYPNIAEQWSGITYLTILNLVTASDREAIAHGQV